MRHHGIDGDDEIEIGDDRRGLVNKSDVSSAAKGGPSGATRQLS